MSEWKLICLPKGEGVEENHKKGKGSLEMRLYSNKDVTAFRAWKLKPVKFSLINKCILDEFLTLVADSFFHHWLVFCRSGTFLTSVQPGINLKMYYVP